MDVCAMENVHFRFVRLLVGIAVFVLPLLEPARAELKLNRQGYFSSPGLDVLFFHNTYPEGKQGGLELIHHGVRVATNGDMRLEPTPEQWDSLPKPGERQMDAASGHVWVVAAFGDRFTYEVHARAAGDRLRVWVELADPLPPHLVGVAGFNLELLPSAFWGKSYYLDNDFGVFPRQAGGPLRRDAQGRVQAAPLGRGSRLAIAPEDPERHLTIQQFGGQFELLDGRNRAQNGWFVVRALLPGGARGKVLEWEIRARTQPGWVRPPMLLHSQVGYHPRQPKRLLIELDPADSSPLTAAIERIRPDGVSEAVLEGEPERWGRFLRYDYAVFDFSQVREPGIYRLRYGSHQTRPFQIADDIYRRNVWQPTLGIYFPVQMDHMEVREAYRVWHGRSHMDDALQAPVAHEHFDGYRQGPETETDYHPFQHVPGLNRGGWYDAGDYDLATGSQASTVHSLALAREEFGVDFDQTHIDQERQYVEILRPDGKPDILQQIEHGVLFLLAGYRIAGHAFPGVIESSIIDYVHLGDGATKTDGQVQEGKDSDDRWVFTNRSTALEYKVAGTLAAASRVLKDYNPDLARECLETAERAWANEQGKEPKVHRSAYIPWNAGREEVVATVELLVTTRRDVYRKRLLELEAVILEGGAGTASAVSRALPMLGDAAFERRLREALVQEKQRQDEELGKNPFRLPFRPQIWGIGWSLQDFAIQQYFLSRSFPDLFSMQPVLDVVSYMLGVHPGSSTSLVSGVGSHSLIPAYGINRADFSYIPGGVASGTGLIRPDFPELKEDWPFLWQQAEYVMGGAADFIFCALAAERVLR
ncbi:MAG: hypothetical protein Kow001_22590 [Acidobacteriota bacterium]